MTLNRDQRRGALLTAVFHVALLLLMIILGLSAPYPPPGEEGIEVNLGSSSDGMGEIQPKELSSGEVQPQPQESSESKDNIITQETEEAPAISEKKENLKKDTEKKKVSEQNIVKETKEKPEEPEVNKRALYTGKTTDNKEGGNEGITGKPGDQGKPTGDPDAEGYDGTGGAGNGISYSLGGRKAKYLEKPSSDFKESGTVVVKIFVDRLGRVVRAIPGSKGTTTSDPVLHRLAREAAMKTQFQQKTDAPQEQQGTITYHFIVKQ